MKPVLSLLTAYILLQTQTWALSGGPVFPTGAPNLAGNYSGVMAQRSVKFGTEFTPPNTGVQPNLDEPVGSIGAFEITVPTDGIASGNAILFVNGTLYTGVQIQGIADPDKTRFDGVIFGDHDFDLVGGGSVTVNIVGEMEVKINEKQGTPLPGQTDTTDGIAARLKGKAVIDAYILTNVDNLTPFTTMRLEYSVSGFRTFTTPL